MSYRLGVDVGGTFTDLLLVDDSNGETYTAKVPSTPEDSSIGVLDGINRICSQSDIDLSKVSQVMHGTTVATNAVLTGKGAKVGLITTKGYRQVLQVARSFCPGGLGGWVSYVKTPLLAPLELTIEADERMGADGQSVSPLDKDLFKKDLELLNSKNKIEALTICFINSYVNGQHEIEAKEIAKKVLGDIPISISSEVVPEMQEYERAETTVVNSYVRPQVSKYVTNLQNSLQDKMSDDVNLAILRSDGGLASGRAAAESPVNLLLSGPAGGVAGAMYFCKRSGFENILTFDMGGTSTDVALIQDGEARVRRETRVGDVTVRAPSVDVRTVGAGGGSIAFVPELTKALRVGPESAGAEPGPAAYKKGGDKATVCDANVVLGYLPSDVKLGGDMIIDRESSVKVVQELADAMGIDLMAAAEGIIKIVNESMLGALRLVSVEQGYDPRDFALVGFGGAGPLHANSLGILTGSWPVIIPPGPGVLCAYGDATTKVRDEASQTYVKKVEDIKLEDFITELEALKTRASVSFEKDGIDSTRQVVKYQADIRYTGQAFQLSLGISIDDLKKNSLSILTDEFDRQHEQLFTFAHGKDHEIVMLRAVVEAQNEEMADLDINTSNSSVDDAKIQDSQFYYEGKWHDAALFERNKIGVNSTIPGPSIIQEMDSTTVILPGHSATVDKIGNLLINPNK
ncbi:MAG: hydantoinase/oxoprolinase family protein [Gammaproteobacteria bacterium]|nr:MAG: hydantoinase/oxoprolinase family protein [Gammaproteobacteria bacterium]|tara:strand:- start:3596 stop:5656 length:2061 start_codon:yes stop_codon:yes gene_type:complete